MGEKQVQPDLLVVTGDGFLPRLLFQGLSVFEELAGVLVVKVLGVASQGQVALPG